MRGFFNFILSKLFICLLLIAAYVGGIIFLCLLLPNVLSVGAAVLGAFVLTAAAAVRAALGGYPAEFRCAWLLIIATLPAVGAAAYFITLYRAERVQPLPLYAGGTEYKSCRYFADGQEYFRALLAAIEGAGERIYLEFFIIAEGEVFSAVCSALGRAIKRGVEVKIITDALGSALRLPTRQLRELKMLGAQVKIFNRLVPSPLSRLNFRDHRKIAAVDGRIALLGGINLADEYANLTRPHGHWKDSAFEVTGGGAALFERLFLSVWDGGARSARPPTGDNSSLPAAGKKLMLPVYDSPPAYCGRASAMLCRMIARAERRVWAFTPYLCPDERVFSALADAAARGVDVKIIIPAVPDKKSAYAVTGDCAARLAARGAQIFAYTPGFMHAKAVICDGGCLLGSYNFDCRSLWLNYECGAYFEGGPTDDVARDFEACMGLSRPFCGQKRKLARLFSPLA